MATLSFSQHWEHSLRMRSLRGVIGGPLNASGTTLLGPRRWRKVLEWLGSRSRRALSIDGVKLVLPDTATAHMVGSMLVDQYETAERYAIAKFLPRNLPVIEFGAGTGAVSCLTNRLLADRSRHWVVEANPRLIDVLRRNRDANHAGFQICHGALAYVPDGAVPLQLDDAVLETHVTGKAQNTVTVPAVTLQQMAQRSGFDQFALICDTEGAEREMVERDGAVLGTQVRAIVLEVHPERLGTSAIAEMARVFTQLGFIRKWEGGDVWFLERN